MDGDLPRSWIDWYRFARREFGYEHPEAVVYANVRTVEDENRRHRRAGDSRAPADERERRPRAA